MVPVAGASVASSAVEAIGSAGQETSSASTQDSTTINSGISQSTGGSAIYVALAVAALAAVFIFRGRSA